MRLIRPAWFLGMALGLFVSALSAQATRTWVSGVGDDANPGSRTAPCKTLAGAISKTAPGGEIDVLDPGGFGGLTITKAITIDGGGGPLASILVSGTNGINVQAGPNDTVVIRNFSITGIGTGLKGIRFISGRALIIDHCQIQGFTDRAIGVEVSVGASVMVTNSDIVNNAGNGIVIIPASGTPVAKVSLSNCRFQGNLTRGLYAGGGAQVTAKDCVFSNNGPEGVDCESSTADVQLDDCDMSHNQVGIRSAAGQVRISNCVVTDNSTAGVQITGGTILSYGNNRINGNAAGDGPVGTVAQQ